MSKVDYSRYKLSLNEAKKIVDIIDNSSDVDFEALVKGWSLFYVSETTYDPAYSDFRETMKEAFKNAMLENSCKMTYDLDLKVGIQLYELLRPDLDQGFDIITANDDDFWRYISVKVMPDITFLRYPNLQSDIDLIRNSIPGYTNRADYEQDSIRLKKKRFYSHTRRIWLKTLWWYVHLGWQGDSKKTYEALKNNGTNIISHFIERPGRGYRERLFRSMLRSYSELPEQKDKIFRAAAKLNLVKCMSVEPELYAGGVQAYSDELFSEVYSKGVE